LRRGPSRLIRKRRASRARRGERGEETQYRRRLAVGGACPHLIRRLLYFISRNTPEHNKFSPRWIGSLGGATAVSSTKSYVPFSPRHDGSGVSAALPPCQARRATSHSVHACQARRATSHSVHAIHDRRSLRTLTRDAWHNSAQSELRLPPCQARRATSHSIHAAGRICHTRDAREHKTRYGVTAAKWSRLWYDHGHRRRRWAFGWPSICAGHHGTDVSTKHRPVALRGGSASMEIVAPGTKT